MNMSQMKEQDTPGEQLSEVKIGNLPEKEFSYTTIKWDLSQGCKDFSISANQSVWYTTIII